jgi:hypothetical protein
MNIEIYLVKCGEFNPENYVSAALTIKIISSI